MCRCEKDCFDIAVPGGARSMLTGFFYACRVQICLQGTDMPAGAVWPVEFGIALQEHLNPCGSLNVSQFFWSKKVVKNGDVDRAPKWSVFLP